MKYSAEELYNLCVEEDSLQELTEALYFNKQGYVTRPLEGVLTKKDNQFYFVAKVHDGFTVEEPLGDGSQEQNDILSKVKLHPEVMAAAISAYDKKYRIRFAFSDKEEERKERLNKTLILDMLTILEIDTIGKAKKLLEDSRHNKATKEAFAMIGEKLKKDNE